jgi:hypothetical protein
MRVQARLVVGRSDDLFEREADLIADRVVAAVGDQRVPFVDDRGSVGAAARVRRHSVVGEGGGDDTRDAESRIQRGSQLGAGGGVVDRDTESRIRRAQRGGSPLAGPVRDQFESAFGADLGRIRLHTGPPATELNERVGATAFTAGSHVFFRRGLPDASSAGGQHLLAHEITHAMQQGALGSTRQSLDVVSPRLQRAFEAAVVTKPAGASLHKSDRKQKALTGANVDVRSGGVFGTGLKTTVPNGALLQVDFAKVSADGDYLLAQHAGTTGYVNKSNVARHIDFIMANAPTLALGLSNAFAQIVPITIDQLRSHVTAATQNERDAVWQNGALMKEAQRALTLDDYLALLPMLRVLDKPSPSIPDPWGTYDTQTLGPMVDTVIRTHLSDYVGGAVGAGRHVEGEMSVVGDEDWKKAFERQWTKPALQPFLATANAFVDVNQPARHIWIHKARGGPGTAIHEGIHKYASPVLRDELINTYKGGGADVSNLDEGTTEFFTRRAIAKGALGYSRASYPSQFKAVKKLVGKVGIGVLARAYFDGNFSALKIRFAAKTGNSWDDYAQALETGDYATANGLIP